MDKNIHKKIYACVNKQNFIGTYIYIYIHKIYAFISI